MLCIEAAHGEIRHSLEKLCLSAECTCVTDASILPGHLPMTEVGYLISPIQHRCDTVTQSYMMIQPSSSRHQFI